MPTLVACLSTGKGTWTEVLKLLSVPSWNKVFLITTSFGQEHFTPKPNIQVVVIDPAQEVTVLVEQIKKQLQGKITDFEIALNLASGSGKEHLALLEAGLELGLNFRLVTWQKGRMEVLGLRK